MKIISNKGVLLSELLIIQNALRDIKKISKEIVNLISWNGQRRPYIGLGISNRLHGESSIKWLILDVLHLLVTGPLREIEEGKI